MISRRVTNREAPARPGYRFVALAGSVAIVISLVLGAAGFAATARGASSSPQSTSKPSAKKGSATSKSSASSKKGKKGGRKHWEPIQKAPTTDRIEEIQTALSREGYYHGEPSKKWDANTQDAMRHFQEDHGMTGSGRLDATTLQKLGLGSDIAGVSAPRPRQNKSDTKSPASNPHPDITPSTTSNADPGGD
jgi:peptidoglycan hydrolase-like protein with peptidoglycan-binding domain